MVSDAALAGRNCGDPPGQRRQWKDDSEAGLSGTGGFFGGVGTACVFHLEGHGRRGFMDAVIGHDLNFYVGLRCSLNGFFGYGEYAAYIDDGFYGYVGHVFDHGWWDVGGFEGNALNCEERRT